MKRLLIACLLGLSLVGVARAAIDTYEFKDEVERELATLFANRAPELIGNDYLVLGTLDRDVWKRGVTGPLAIQEMVEQLHDFVEVLELRRAGV